MSANFLNLNVDGKYIIACAYGPDSMCLLDLVQERGIKPVVCFINYHSYDSIDQEQASLTDYCASKGLTLEIFDTNDFDQTGKEDHFENWARRARYGFFKKIYEKYDADGLLIAHSQDDIIETYLTAKKIGHKFDKYGFSPLSTFEGMVVIRPLLNFSREDILEHNRRANVPYSEHMSTYEHQHTRSAIRQEIERMNESDRDRVIEEMKKEYSEKTTFAGDLTSKAEMSEELGVRELIALPKDEFFATLSQFIANKSPIKITLKSKQANEIREMLLNHNPVTNYQIKGNVYLVKEYDIVSVEVDPDKIRYSYRLDAPGTLKTDEFELDFSMGATDRNIKDEDYPLTIRTMLPGDEYVYRGYRVSLRRVYLDENMPREYREIWPVFVNKDSSIVYVPRFHKIFKEYHTSKLVLHLPDLSSKK